VAASWRDDLDRLQTTLGGAQRVAQRLLETSMPSSVAARTAEGFAYYAVYPEQYVEAARRMAAALSPPSVTCVGIRGIGATLAHVVSASLEIDRIPNTVVTVRPRGHPFDRHLAITDRLRAVIRSCRGYVAVV